MNNTTYDITFKKSVRKDIKKIPKEILKTIFQSIEQLRSIPIPSHANKLKGSDTLYRIREGNYRIIYEIKAQKVLITIVRIGHRKKVYLE